MKKMMFLALALVTTSSFAFNSITLKNEAVLKQNLILKSLYFSFDAARGSDYCSLSLVSQENVESLAVPAGTVFEVETISQNACGNDWGKVCRLDLTARNHEQDVKLSLLCKDKGVFAKKLSVSKVNALLGNSVLVK